MAELRTVREDWREATLLERAGWDILVVWWGFGCSLYHVCIGAVAV